MMHQVRLNIGANLPRDRRSPTIRPDDKTWRQFAKLTLAHKTHLRWISRCNLQIVDAAQECHASGYGCVVQRLAHRWMAYLESARDVRNKGRKVYCRRACSLRGHFLTIQNET